MFPVERPRRLRRTAALRALVRETRLDPADFMLPLFVREGRNLREPVPSLPGVYRWSPDRVAEAVAEALAVGVRAVILFGVADRKGPEGSEAWRRDGVVPQAVARLRDRFGERLVIATDVCLCAYTDHGHCGIVAGGRVVNDATLEALARMAVVHAEAGADLVAPSDMMDGRVAAIRRALDEAGFAETVGIMAYSVKYASALYGPFRDAAHSAPAFGDRRSYQMDPANAREALREAALDAAEGADLVMVKPALAYLDVIHAVRRSTRLPVAAYHVSGEYAMLKAAAERGWLDERAATLEVLTAIRRAGADLILTYSAVDAARWLQDAAEEGKP